MKEIRDIVAAYDRAVAEGKRAALATIVKVEGSSYRREGARMLITEDGQLTGAISGGCLEGDALRKAQLVMARQQGMVVTYDTNEEDDAKMGLGLGCNGTIQILIEPIDDLAAVNPITLLKGTLKQRLWYVLVTLFSFDKNSPQPGTCLLVKEGGAVKGNIEDPVLRKDIETDAKAALREGVQDIHTYGEYIAFHSVIKPAKSLVVVGGGNDAIPLTEMSHALGWETTVIDGRPNYATAVRFPKAQKVVVAKANGAIRHVTKDTETAVVLMTHNYHYDLEVLGQLLPLEAIPYIGVLGPKKKLHRMLDELSSEGHNYTYAQAMRVYGPMGLDIGASTPEEIALSILAEVQAVMSKKSGTALRERSLPIHA
jgi:xanthine dehydrogenase accessory factor